MRIEDWNKLHELVSEAAESLFDSVGIPVVSGGILGLGQISWPERLAIIGLGGKIRGSLVLSVAPKLLERSHPSKAKERRELNDWLAELSNLLLGRVKLSLLARGIATELTTPLLVSATDFRFERFAGAPAVHSFLVDGEPIYVIFEAVAEEGVSLSPVRENDVLRMGEMVTF